MIRGSLPSRTALALLALSLLAPPAAGARTVSGVSFPEREQDGDDALEVCSAALLRWNWVLKVYVAGLYLNDCADLTRPLGDVPRRLEISYLRGFDGPQFVKAADTILERTFSESELAPLRERIDRFHEAYRSSSRPATATPSPTSPAWAPSWP